MSNFTISDMAPITLPLDPATTFFESQAVEGGLQVSRKVSASDLGIGGSVISVNSGVNINVDNTDPLNPIVNMPVAIAGLSVNGVTLNDGGAATAFLNETGVYSVPSGSGQVDSVVGGLNIDVDATDPINPIVNMPAAITGMTVNGVVLNTGGLATDYLNETGAYNSPTNGVVLTSGGVATNYLDETGAYSVPPSGGGQVDSVIGGTNISVNAGDPVNPTINLDAAITGVSVDGVTLTTAGAATNYLDETGAYSVPPAGAVPDPLILGSINLTSSLTPALGTPYNNVPINIGANLIGTQGMTRLARQRIQTQPSAFSWNSTLFINTEGAGTAGSDTIIGGLNSANIEIEFGVAVRFQHGLVSTVVAETAAPAAGGLLANNLATGAGLERVLTTADLGGSVPDPLILGSINLTSALSTSTLGAPYINVPINVGANLTGTQGMTQISRQRIQTKPSAFSFNSTLFINTDGAGTSGSNTFIGGLNSASIEVDFGVAVRMQHGTVSTVVAETAAPAAGGFLVNNTLTGAGLERVLTVGDLGGGGIAATPTPASGEVAVWDSTGATLAGEPDLFYTGTTLRINNGLGGACLDLRDGNSTGSAANVSLNFTDQVGTVLSTVGDVLGILLLSNPNGQVSLVAGTGGTEKVTMDALSIQLEEAAAPGANNAGYGQYWVRSASPCRPEFRDDTDVNQLLDPSISEIISVVASRVGILTDKGKTVGFTGGTAAQTMTIPANGSVPYQIGTFLAWDNSGSVSISIAITTDTLIFADDNSTGTRTLAAGGHAVAQKVGATTWKIAGAGLS